MSPRRGWGNAFALPAAGLGVTQIIGPVVPLSEDGAGASSARPHMRQLNGVERGQVRVHGGGSGLTLRCSAMLP